MAITFTVKTLSNLYIGGTPQTFEIGGVDMQTATDDCNGQPYIPASSFKGALREIVKDTPNEKIAGYYRQYLINGQSEFESKIKGRSDEIEFKKSYQALIDDNNAHLYLFGIPGFNHAPKLIFNDLKLILEPDTDKPDKWFSIDMKNSIEETESNRLKSNPRSYKTARKGLSFAGMITLYQPQKLSNDAASVIESYLKNCLDQFKEGIYRIGNSKSRGYGWIEATVLEG